MEINDISRLASYLRKNGDQILNGANKLTLTAQILQKLNEAFHLVIENDDSSGPSRFQVINTNNSNVEIFHDLAFLHDFVQKTVSLKLTNTHCPAGSTSVKGSVDISKFGNVKYLELNKVPVEIISGIQDIQSQIDTLVCVRCLGKLEDVLKSCGADERTGSVWSELQKGVFSYNGLDSLDQSLSYSPWLQILDLSHNRLTNADPLALLPNLKCLNLSYNLLQSVPMFNTAATQKLLVLVVKFNYLENLVGLCGLENLKNLDLSCNCLTDHSSSLLPLLQLPSLSWLSLEGNPLSYQKRHRVLTAQCLHNNCTNIKFLLDCVALSKSERLSVGKLQFVGNKEPVFYTPSAENLVVSEAVASRNVMHNSTPKSNAPKKSGRVREAYISNYQEEHAEPDLHVSLTSSSLELSVEHLETKKQIETLREKFGEENWLHSRGGSFVQDVLGLAHSPNPALLSLTPSLAQYEDKSSYMHQQVLSSLPTKEPGVNLSIVEPPKDVNEDVPKEMVTSSDSLFGPKELSPDLPENDDSHDDGEDELDEHVYPVQRETGTSHINDELFLVVATSHIKEKEIHFGKTLEKWTVASLSSCVKVRNEPAVVQLTFDTMRRDRQERRYIMEEDDAQSLVRTLGTVLDLRPLSAMHQMVYRCLNCSSQFSHELDSWSMERKKRNACPNCESTLVIEVDEVPLPDKSLDYAKEQISHGATEAQSSTMVKSSSQSSIGSAASLDVSPEWPKNGGGHVVRRSDSDIEIISNPSESSIEVLDDRGTPIRKRSEERQTVTTVPDSRVQLLSLAGLTESSSSGSFTDSICTTYENRSYSSLPRGNTNTSTDEKEEACTISEENELCDTIDKNTNYIDSGNGCSVKDSESSTETLEDMVVPKVVLGQSPVINLTSVIEGLLNSVSSKLSKSPHNQSSTPGNLTTATNHVEYAYKDYSVVDHRLKLHLYLSVFEAEHEQLTMLIRGNIMNQGNSSWYPGCVVVTTHKVYFLRVIDVEGDDPDKWLKTVESRSVEQLEAVRALPWNQGISLEFKQVDVLSVYLLLLQDSQRTGDLFTFVAGIPSIRAECLHPSWLVPASIDELIQTAGPQDASNTTCTVFNSFTLLTCSLGLGALIITSTDIIICKDLLWLFPKSVSKVHAFQTQKMNNLLEVEVVANVLTLHFLDESIEKDETWVFHLATENSLRKVIAAIQVPWEKLFLVPLQITHTAKS